uniref:FERM domain-containing protein n=1 Tax=Trichogramma kaykai TaxID=54128 RepID=A0ABD2XCG7_9HYME
MLKFGSKNDVTVVYRATIRLLDDAEIIHCDFQPQHKGKYILEHVCKQLNILETDYFGLRYVDSCRQRHWLDLAKTAIKQVKDMEPILFSFRVKFYPPDPLRLKEEITRYQIYQQLKRDLLHGRLYCSPGEAALLAACIVQSELGDYDPELHEGNYIAENKLLLKQTESIEEKALELHQTQLKGFSPEQAETHFLRLAAQLDTYAVDPHPVKDQKGTPLYLGINHHGILTFQGSRKTNHFRWPEVQKINYEGKMFIVHLTITEKKHTVGFKCPTGSNCRHVWRCAIEQMLFFTLPRASDAPVMSGGSLFSWGTKFKYTGRTEREVLEEVGPLRKEEPPIQRCHSTGLRRKASSVPATPSTPSQDLCEIRYSSLPRSCHSAGLDGAGMGDIGSGGMPLSSPYCPDNTLPLLETVSEDQEIHARRNNDEENDHEMDTTSTTTTTTTCHVTTTTTTTTITTSETSTTPISITTDAPKISSTTNNDNNNINNSSSSSSSNNININNNNNNNITPMNHHQSRVKLKMQQQHLQRPPLSSHKVVISSDELQDGRDIDRVVRRRIDEFNKSPRVVRTTALIVKRSFAPAKPRPLHPPLLLVNDAVARVTSDLALQTIKLANGDATSLASYSTSTGTGGGGRDDDNVDGSVLQHDYEGNDYYFRDSFDHSSSESQLLDASGGTLTGSRSSIHQPVPKMQRLQNSKIGGGGGLIQKGGVSSSTSALGGPNSVLRHRHSHLGQHQQHMGQPMGASSTSASDAANKLMKRRAVKVVKLLVPALVLTVTVLLVVTIVVFETDSKLFEALRKTPEMVALRAQYYAPVKNFLKRKFGFF